MTGPALQSAAASPDAAPGRAGAWARPQMEEDLAVLGLLRDACLAVALAIRDEVEQRAESRAAAVPGDGEGAEAPASPPSEPVLSKAEGRVEGLVPDKAAGHAEGPAPRPVDGPQVFTGDPVLAMHRAARAVRLTCALRARLVEEIEALDELQTRRAHHRLAEARAARKARIASLLGRIIEDETFGPEAGDEDDEDALEIEAGEFEGGEREGRETETEAADAYDRLVFEANERLEDRERFGDVLDQPVSAFVDAVCRDLGLSPDWPRLAREAWAKEEIASGKVGAPLTSLSSTARGGGGPQPVLSDAAGGVEGQPVEGAQPRRKPRPSAPSVTARTRRATFPARGEGEPTRAPIQSPTAEPPPRPPPAAAAPAPPDPFQPPPRPRPPNVLSPDWGWTPTRS